VRVVQLADYSCKIQILNRGMRRRGRSLQKFTEERDHDMEASLKVLIADDHPLILQGLRRALECSDGIEVVGEARSGDEVLALVKRRSPHLVLLDLRMPGLGGLECIAELNRSSPDIKTVVLSA